MSSRPASGVLFVPFEHPHPFRPDGRLTRVLPFAIPTLLGLAAVADRLAAAPSPYWLAAVAGLTLASVASVFAVPWQRLPAFWAAAPPLTHIFTVFLMREGAGIGAPYVAPLLILPLFWLALHGTRVQLLVGFALTAATAFASHQLHGVSGDGARFQGLAIMVMSIVCFTAQHLMRQVREQALLLEAVARVDMLTGVSNRRDWEIRLPEELVRARRDGKPLCVAMLDLDHFKRLNDEQGHQAGDQVLRESARAWKRQVRRSDLLARYGGEEFAVLLSGCDLEPAVKVVERLRSATARGETCSAGVVRWDGEESAEALVARADQALYRAKALGRNRTVATPLQPESEPIPAEFRQLADEV